MIGKLKIYEIKEENEEICNIKMTVNENDDLKVDEIFKKIDCFNRNGYLNFSLSKFDNSVYLSDIIIKSDITGEFIQVTAKPESLLILTGKFDDKTETSFNRNHTIIYKNGCLTLYDKEDNSFAYNTGNIKITEKTFDDTLDFFADKRILVLAKYYTSLFPKLLDAIVSLTGYEIAKCFKDNSRSRKKTVEEQV